jgi:SAM-dependent methyltransferase
VPPNSGYPEESRRRPPRTRLLQEEIDRSSGRRYLEIGVGDGGVFLNLSARRKTAVDPRGLPMRRRLRHPSSLLRDRVFAMTSDEFFDGPAKGRQFDVCFVDGYHTWDQALRDVENCLRHMPGDGVVVMHDCNPPNEPAAMRDPAAAARRPDSDGAWCGDVWKAVVLMRSTRPDLRVEVLDTDYGLGIVRRGEGKTIPLDPELVPEMTYADLDSDRERLLGLRPA